MKKKLRTLVGLMALCAVGTVGSALALDVSNATVTGTTGKYDQAVYLYWGDGAASASLSPAEGLQSGDVVYRYLTVAPQSTKSVAGTVTITFSLVAPTPATNHIEGLTIEVYRTDVEAIDDDNKATYCVAGNLKTTINSTNATRTDTFAISNKDSNNVAYTVVHSTIQYYAFKISYTAQNIAGKSLNGTLTITQSFAANA